MIENIVFIYIMVTVLWAFFFGGGAILIAATYDGSDFDRTFLLTLVKHFKRTLIWPVSVIEFIKYTASKAAEAREDIKNHEQ